MLQYISMGGNKKFREFLETYKLQDESIQVKYKSKAANYYRLNVNSLIYAQLSAVMEGKPVEVLPPPHEEGRKALDALSSPAVAFTVKE